MDNSEIVEDEHSKEDRSKEKFNKNYKLIGYLPIIFIIVILPLITRGKVVELSEGVAAFWKGGNSNVDFFSYYKSNALIIATCVALLGALSLYMDKKITIQNDKSYYIPMGVYVLLVILSTLLSPHKDVAILGFVEMYQGMSVLLSYMAITFILMNFQSEERDIKIVVYSIAAVSVIVGILGLSQYFGHDFLKTSIGRWLITPKALQGEDLKFHFGKYTIYATMYNTNFVGSFGALVLPITTALYMYGKNKRSTVIFYVAAVLSFATWLGSNSRAGYVGIIGASLIGIVVFRKL
jgi:hypothetical protein